MTVTATHSRTSALAGAAHRTLLAFAGGLLASLAACADAAPALPVSATATVPAPAATTPDATALALIPYPASVKTCSGEFMIDEHTPIIATNDEVAKIAHWFADTVARTHGANLSPKSPRGAPISFELQPAQATDTAEDERYVLDVSPKRISVAAPTLHGLFNGATTLWQLLTLDAAHPQRVPCVHIEDRPRFAWRGLMLDPARHFQSPKFVKQFIDDMALHKFNVLQWHLTDDQGWRIEIKKYPKLTQVGAWRQPAGKAGFDESGKPLRYGGFYTQAQIRDIVAYAQQRFVTIVPEIEMPGHAQAAIAAYPQLGVGGRNPGVSRDWGVHTWLYNVDDATFGFLEDVLGEVMDLFPSKYIHIGGDEAAKDQWIASARVQARMHALGLKDETALQGWFTRRMEAFLAAHGRKLIGWDEILEGGIPAQATVMSWRGIKGAIDASRQGHDVVLSPDPSLYFDHLSGDLPDEPAGRPAVLSVRDVYDFAVVPADLDAAQATHVLGAQAPLWSEYLRTDASVMRAAFPRAAALAEVLWSAPAAHDWPGFLARLAVQQARYRALGIDYAQSAFAVHIDATLDAQRRNARVTLANQTGFGEIRYTLDGSAPTAESTRYAAPFDAPATGEVRAVAFVRAAPLSDARVRKLEPLALLRRNSAELAQCNPKSGVILKLPEDIAANATRDAYVVDIFDPCWSWPRADLTGIDHLEVDATSMPYNFQLWKDAKNIVERKPATYPSGELQLRLDGCAGAPVRTLALTPLLKIGRGKLTIPLAGIDGTHDLCLRFATGGHDPLWVIAAVQLVPKR
ncbi:MAG: family 20 glycosylhydrolase [Rudaea sp.]